LQTQPQRLLKAQSPYALTRERLSSAQQDTVYQVRTQCISSLLGYSASK